MSGGAAALRGGKLESFSHGTFVEGDSEREKRNREGEREEKSRERERELLSRFVAAPAAPAVHSSDEGTRILAMVALVRSR